MKAILFSTVSGWMARLLAIGLNLIGFRIIFENLGGEKLGLFLILTGIVSWVTVADLSTTRTITRFATRKWRRDLKLVGTIFTHGLIITFVLNAFLFTVFVTATLSIPWTRVVNGLNDQNQREFVAALIVLGGLLSFGRFLSPFEGMRAAMQSLYILNLWRIVSYVIAFGALFLWISTQSSLIAIILVLSAGSVLADAANAIALIVSRGALIRTDIKLRLRIVKAILSDSLLNLAITISFVVVFQFSVSLIGIAVGPEATVTPGAALRVLISLLAFLHMLLHPMWSAISAACGQRDRKRATTIATYCGIAIILFGVIAAILVLLFGERAISIWLGGSIDFNLPLRVAFAILIMSSFLDQYLVALLYGLGNMKVIAVICGVEAVIGVGGGYLLTLAYGPIGMMYCIAITQCVIAAPVFIISARSGFQKIK